MRVKRTLITIGICLTMLAGAFRPASAEPDPAVTSSSSATSEEDPSVISESPEIPDGQEGTEEGEGGASGTSSDETVSGSPVTEETDGSGEEDPNAEDTAEDTEEAGETEEEVTGLMPADEAEPDQILQQDESEQTEEEQAEEEEESEEEEEEEEEEEKTASVSYRTHVQTYGWQDWKKDGQMSGTSGQSKRLEAIQIRLTETELGGDIEYRTHVQTYGWQGWAANGGMSGTSGEAKRLEAIRIRLTGEVAERYDVWYCVHAQRMGWMGWAKNGEMAGTAGCSYRLEGIKIRLVEKGGPAPGRADNAFYQNYVKYQTHVQSYGWGGYVTDGALSGTVGEAKRLEAIRISLVAPRYSGSIQYRTHVQTYGWQGWVSNGAMSGTSGEAKRLEAIQIRLTGQMAQKYDIYYCVHAQTFGWMDWAKNGASAGTSGLSKRLEGIRIVLVPKGSAAPGSTKQPYLRGKYTANALLAAARGWLGARRGDRTHKRIVDLYNSVKPLPVGYKVKYTDAWCDTFVTACAIKAGVTSSVGRECGCERHIRIFKKLGIWNEDGEIYPRPGDLILFNWTATRQPNNSTANHIAIVESVGWSTLVCIEGNSFAGTVARRVVPIGDVCIRGYAQPATYTFY